MILSHNSVMVYESSDCKKLPDKNTGIQLYFRDKVWKALNKFNMIEKCYSLNV